MKKYETPTIQMIESMMENDVVCVSPGSLPVDPDDPDGVEAW